MTFKPGESVWWKNGPFASRKATVRYVEITKGSAIYTLSDDARGETVIIPHTNVFGTDPDIKPATFKPGQTVWSKKDARAWTILASDEGDVWAKREDGHRNIVHESNFTATDPRQSAPIEPQKCPFCGGKPHVHVGYRNSIDIAVVLCYDEDGCAFKGPVKSTREEAIAAWNSIRVEPNRQEILDGSTPTQSGPGLFLTRGEKGYPPCRQCGAPGKYPYCGPCAGKIQNDQARNAVRGHYDEDGPTIRENRSSTTTKPSKAELAAKGCSHLSPEEYAAFIAGLQKKTKVVQELEPVEGH